MKLHFSSLFLLLAFLTACNDDPNEPSENESTLKLVDVGGHMLEYMSAGNGAHTIVLEVGLDGNMEEFINSDIYSDLSENYQVIAYHRAGYGDSERGPLPRSLAQITDELNTLIQSVSNNDKVILAGHSLGGGFVRVYATRFPENTEALLLIDPSHEDFVQLSQAEVDEFAASREQQGAKDEASNLIEMNQEIAGYGNMPDIPTTVLTATLGGENLELWRELHISLGEGISESNFTQMDVDTGHNIHVTDPGLILESIDDLVEKL